MICISYIPKLTKLRKNSINKSTDPHNLVHASPVHAVDGLGIGQPDVLLYVGSVEEGRFYRFSHVARRENQDIRVSM